MSWLRPAVNAKKILMEDNDYNVKKCFLTTLILEIPEHITKYLVPVSYHFHFKPLPDRR
jgi:hypothetical protein